MTSFFWVSQGVITVNYLKEGHMINGAYFAEKLKLYQEIVKKRRGKLTQDGLHLQDNAPALSSQVGMAAVIKCS